ncbi:sigma-54 dependent transcriptional regulator [bacterium]|nr:sigma-54 dependent transcriptional regulator [bacterium]
MKDTLLIVDDEADLLTGLKRSISQELDCRVLTAIEGAEAMGIFQNVPVDLVLTDISMPGMNGMTLLNKIVQQDRTVPVIIMTGYGTIEMAVEALKQGAFDFIQKPFDLSHLLQLIKKGLDSNRLDREKNRLQQQICEQSSLEELMGESNRMQTVRQQIRTLAKTDVPVLITGETGTGKELAAKAIHEISNRRDKRMITVNCPALPEGLLESELFGHRKGAFTGANEDKKGLFDRAEGSTIFLDEIGDLPQSLQTKLLRVLQNMEVRPIGAEKSHRIDVRVLAATNQDLALKIKSGKFRSDLFYRLNVATLVMPPLAEIREDIPVLVQHFLTKSACELKTEPKSISTKVLEQLKTHDWPGNTRELENVIRAWTATLQVNRIKLENIEIEDSEGFAADIDLELEGPYKLLKEKIIERFTREYICRLLKQTNGNISVSARISGIKRQSFQKIINRYEINVHDYR